MLLDVYGWGYDMILASIIFKMVKINMKNIFSKHECMVYMDEIW
jgi:hypothetical protein